MVWSPREKIIDTRFIGQNILQYISDNQEDALLWANGVSSWKVPVRVASLFLSNVDINSPGSAIDGVTLVLNDRVLLKDQGLAEQSGIYQWNGADVPMTRTADADTAAEVNLAAVFVEEGTSANRWFKQTLTVTTLDVSEQFWQEFAAARKKFELFLESLGDNLPIFPSLILLDDGNATVFDSDILLSAYKVRFEVMVSGAIAANVPDAAKRYAYALESMLKNIPKASLAAGAAGIDTAVCGEIETTFDVLKNNEQKTAFYQLFQTEATYDLTGSAY